MLGVIVCLHVWWKMHIVLQSSSNCELKRIPPSYYTNVSYHNFLSFDNEQIKSPKNHTTTYDLDLMSKVPMPVLRRVTYSNGEWALNVILDRALDLALRTFHVITSQLFVLLE